MSTCATRGAPGVEIGVLIQRNREAAVVVAEDISTLSAVMPSRKVAEVLPAQRVIADRGFVVRLLCGGNWLACGS